MSTAHATAAAPEDDALRGKASVLSESAFAKSAATAADIARTVDQARPNNAAALANVASGPLLMQQTLSVLDVIPDVPFDQLCNDGRKVCTVCGVLLGGRVHSWGCGSMGAGISGEGDG